MDIALARSGDKGMEVMSGSSPDHPKFIPFLIKS